MDLKNQKIKRPKRQTKVEETWWDCSVCTFRNTASEAFKCLMCDVRKGTSTRKPKLNSALVAQQASQQVFPGGSGTPPNSSKSSKLPRNKNKRTSKYVRLKNIDRSSGQTREVTVNQVTVLITEFKPKPPKRHDSSESYSESNDSRS